MIEIIEKLNHTSATRTVFYALVFIIVVAIIADCVASIVKSIFKRFRE